MLKNFGKFNKAQSNTKGQRVLNSERHDENTPIYESAKSITLNSSYRVASCQSNGLVRLHNEDTVFTLNSYFGAQESVINFGIYLVADGMGGHQGGELASKLAASSTSYYLLNKLSQAILLEDIAFHQEDIKTWLNEAVNQAQELILNRVPGGGTTLTLVLMIADNFYFAHVGDSRLYTIELNGTSTVKTRDHSLVKRLIELGEISENEAKVFPQKNILYRALGQSDPFEADIESFSIEVGERLLICSDGLWGALEHETINRITHLQQDLESIAYELIQQANDAGGPDNISVVLLERVG